jgi:hypothetical protein
MTGAARQTSSSVRRIDPGPLRRLETWLWTGPAGHLVAGLLDWFQAVAVWLAHAARRRVARRRGG